MMSKAIETLREHFNQKPVPNSKVLIEERDRVNAMIDAVEAENANLRKAAEFEHNQLQDIKCAVDMMLEEHNAMFVENARLRELVRDMWHEGAFEAGACYVEEADRLEERTRELGIEV